MLKRETKLWVTLSPRTGGQDVNLRLLQKVKRNKTMSTSCEIKASVFDLFKECLDYMNEIC